MMILLKFPALWLTVMTMYKQVISSRECFHVNKVKSNNCYKQHSGEKYILDYYY